MKIAGLDIISKPVNKCNIQSKLSLCKSKCMTKIYFCGFELTKIITNLRTQPMHFRENFGKYRTQKAMNVIVLFFLPDRISPKNYFCIYEFLVERSLQVKLCKQIAYNK